MVKVLLRLEHVIKMVESGLKQSLSDSRTQSATGLNVNRFNPYSRFNFNLIRTQRFIHVQVV